MSSGKVPWFVKRDLDGFFGLFIDNLVQLLVIAELTTLLCGFQRAFVYGRILPAAAISIILGNVYYSMQARRIARELGRDDVTALPYGINTPSVFAYIFFIMAPVFGRFKAELGEEAAADLAWKMGLIACLGSGLIEFGGAFIAEKLRRITPRAALLSALAGIALTFISMDFVLQVFEHPLLAILPMGIILMQYTSGVRLPLGMPAGLAALLVGTALGWGIKGFTLLPIFDSLSESVRFQLSLEVSSMPDRETFRENFIPVMALPQLAISEIADFFRGEGLPLVRDYLGIILPMGLFNLIGSLQNIESAEAAGDTFPTRPSLAVNGVGTLVGAAFGSCFPTTLYIGHPGWKQLGARTGYSLLNGFVIGFICLTGLIQSFATLVPTESVIGILLWIAIVMTAQAFQSVPKKHSLAVAIGLIPAIAAWGLLVFKNGLMSAGTFPGQLALESAAPGAHLGGLYGLSAGFLLTSMCLSAMTVMMIERRFRAAAGWVWTLAVLSFFGITHAWNPQDLGQEYAIGIGNGWTFAVAYALWGAMLFALSGRVEPKPEGEEDGLFG